MNSSAAPPALTPALGNTTTQTSAPVSRFRCLFSHDLRRKAKRWRDGFLRFHSFNKRIMVYDVQGNFIGDLHWRDGEELNDGDELELEHGVLVQVEECVEKSQTDLTELLDKRKHASSASSPARPFSPAPSSARSFAVTSSNIALNSSGRPKSLNELLGIKRAPIGRAAVPLKSPYEERQQSIRPQGGDTPTERAPKRQRINGREPERDVDGTSRQRPLRDSNSYSSASNLARSFQPAKDLALSESTPSRSSKNTPNITKDGEKTKSQTVIDLTSSTGSFNTLRIAVEKPRKKLMYKDLLPQAVQRSSSGSNQCSRESQSIRKQRDRQSSLEDTADEVENIPPSAPGFKSAALASTEINSTLHFVPSSSTLHALEESLPPSSPQKHKPINEFFKPSGQKPPPRPTSTTKGQKEPSPDPVLHEAQTITTTNMNSTTTTEDPPHKYPDKPPSPLRTLARSHSDISPSLAIPNNPVSHPAPPQPPPPPTLQRSESLPTSNEASNPPQPAPQPAAAALNPIPAPPKPLQKSLSDASSALGRTTSAISAAPRTRQSLLAPKRNQHVATCVDVDEEEQGPWTEEALDLFDWWPPGREKPGVRKGVV
ncbi:hypothetical protein AJ79_06255 [Helicocarpus griseus UAMH5409]|uniref:5'-3' DNA helicase ZGRF1-like N-terminal domain-containing protein n=1 Tax=Helicocarpus griseus UAMH5409 TaxID=1447875 RepID=A0A2B7XF40_9EURO|nr:hypothetical protein AJ79_06255 [Helicocarpus griseus UAMH5409]